MKKGLQTWWELRTAILATATLEVDAHFLPGFSAQQSLLFPEVFGAELPFELGSFIVGASNESERWSLVAMEGGRQALHYLDEFLERNGHGLLLPEGQADGNQRGLLLVGASFQHEWLEPLGALVGAGEGDSRKHLEGTWRRLLQGIVPRKRGSLTN